MLNVHWYISRHTLAVEIFDSISTTRTHNYILEANLYNCAMCWEYFVVPQPMFWNPWSKLRCLWWCRFCSPLQLFTEVEHHTQYITYTYHRHSGFAWYIRRLQNWLAIFLQILVTYFIASIEMHTKYGWLKSNLIGHWLKLVWKWSVAYCYYAYCICPRTRAYGPWARAYISGESLVTMV